MAHFAKLDENGLVLEVNVVSNSVLDENNEEASGIAFLVNWSGGYTNWKQTSYNGRIRKNFAAIGYTYLQESDVFIAPQPYNSWKLSNIDYTWKPPKPQPNDGWVYLWNEEILNWENQNFKIGELPTEGIAND
jgi:hypothetical protein